MDLVTNGPQKPGCIKQGAHIKVAEQFPHALANAIQHVHKDCKNKHATDTAIIFLCSMPALSLLFFFLIERGVLMALVFYNKSMLEKVTMRWTQQFSDFLISKEPS